MNIVADLGRTFCVCSLCIGNYCRTYAGTSYLGSFQTECFDVHCAGSVWGESGPWSQYDLLYLRLCGVALWWASLYCLWRDPFCLCQVELSIRESNRDRPSRSFSLYKFFRQYMLRGARFSTYIISNVKVHHKINIKKLVRDRTDAFFSFGFELRIAMKKQAQ